MIANISSPKAYERFGKAGSSPRYRAERSRLGRAPSSASSSGEPLASCKPCWPVPFGGKSLLQAFRFVNHMINLHFRIPKYPICFPPILLFSTCPSNTTERPRFRCGPDLLAKSAKVRGNVVQVGVFEHIRKNLRVVYLSKSAKFATKIA